jgi:hypothetical protein
VQRGGAATCRGPDHFVPRLLWRAGGPRRMLVMRVPACVSRTAVVGVVTPASTHSNAHCRRPIAPAQSCRGGLGWDAEGLHSIVMHMLLTHLGMRLPLHAVERRDLEIRRRIRRLNDSREPAPLWPPALDWRCPLCVSFQTDCCMLRTVRRASSRPRR